MQDITIGPYARERIVLCSADASPHSQLSVPAAAEDLFPGATFVRAMGNAARRLRCRFVIFAAPYGVVSPLKIIEPFDIHGTTEEERASIREQCHRSVPQLLGGGRYDAVVLYCGAVPRDIVLDTLGLVVTDNGLDLITFGKPNTWDLGKINEIVAGIMAGSYMSDLRSCLKAPDRLLFMPGRAKCC
jgi:hypothetical protein